MSVVKKSDVKNHLSPRYRTQIHLCQPESAPDATDFSATETDALQSNSLNLSDGFAVEYSPSGIVVAPDNPQIDSIGPQAPAASRGVQP